MSKELRILHGDFGRALLVQLDKSVTVHAHRTCQLLFRVDEGEVEVSVQNGRHRMDKQEVVMLNAWEPHSYERAKDQTPATVLALYIEPAWLKRNDQRFACSMHPRFFSVPFGVVPSAAQGLVDKLVDTITYEPTPTPLDVETLILDIVLALTAKYSDAAGLSSFQTVGGASCDVRIRKVLSIMRDSVGEPIVVEDLARLARMSRPHFFHLFKQETQLTPIGFSSMLRMEMAIKKITETTESLHDISMCLGFESPGNFTRFFNMHQGISPSEYRRSATLLSQPEQAPTVVRRDHIGIERIRATAEARC